MKVLGIETSCDETSAALVEGGMVLGGEIVSQADLHRVYGGVVPELASREHLQAIGPVVQTALQKARLSTTDIDLVAVTQGPGLVGALAVGLSFAKALAWSMDRPIIGVNHLLGHVWANALAGWQPVFPVLALLVSGGHTDFFRLDGPHPDEVTVLGRTRDDAAGEAFDKVARILGLPYPGGPAIEALSADGDPDAVALPKVQRLRNSLDVSFSGIKTAVYDRMRSPDPPRAADMATAFQRRVVDELVSRVIRMVRQTGVRSVLLGGGVSANASLRRSLEEAAVREGFRVHIPPRDLCTDNGAMIAAAGVAAYEAGMRSTFEMEPIPVMEPYKTLRHPSRAGSGG